MTGAVEAGSVLIKKNKKNIMFMTSLKGLIRYTQRITAIYKKIRKNQALRATETAFLQPP